MGTIRIIPVLTALFSVSYCYQIAFSFDIPILVDTFSNLATRMLEISPRAFDDMSSLGTPLAEKLPKIGWNVVGYMTTMLTSLSRRSPDMKPNVEMGPGAFKPEIQKYPENYFVNRLKTLIKIKQREEERNKPLNKE